MTRTIAYVGNYKHPWCTEVHIAATLEDLGFEVLRVQEDNVNGPGGFDRLDELEDLASRACLLLYTRTWGFAEKAAAIAMFRRLEERGVPTASYHLDLYLGLERQVTLEGDPFWATQYVFTPDGDPASQAEFERRGISHYYIRPGVFRDECEPGRPQRRFRHDVAFVGSYPYPHPEWAYRNTLIDHLRHTYRNRFAIWGGRHGVVRGQALNDLYASVKVVVGDSLCPGFTKPHYWSDRPYETVGRGGFLIMPRIAGLEEDFTDAEHLRFYDFCDFEGLDDLIDHYVAHPPQAREIAREGQAHVRANHTYHQRLSQALQIMEIEL